MNLKYPLFSCFSDIDSKLGVKDCFASAGQNNSL